MIEYRIVEQGNASAFPFELLIMALPLAIMIYIAFNFIRLQFAIKEVIKDEFD